MKYLNKEFFGVGTKNYLKAYNELKITSDREIIKEKLFTVILTHINFIMNSFQNMVFWEP